MSLEVKKNARESISSFVDGELNSLACDDVVGLLHSNDSQKQVWGRYCVMSDAIKRTLPQNINHNLLERVQLALESEPALLAPAPPASSQRFIGNAKTEAEIVELPVKSTKTNSVKSGFGFGIAATVTIAAVLGFQLFTQTSDLPNQAIIASSNNVPATTQIQIAATPVVELATTSSSVSFDVVDELQGENGNATYAEQSLIDDGQWTRITQVDGIPLANHFLSGRPESHVQFKFQNQNSPFARSVNLDANGNP